MTEEIVCSIAVRNRSILKRTLHLYLLTLPAIVEGIHRWSTLTENHPSGLALAQEGLTKQRRHTFEQCVTILLQWSEASATSPPRSWVDTVDPNHLKAQQKLGNLGDDDNSDVEGDGSNSVDYGSTPSFGSKPPLSPGSKRKSNSIETTTKKLLQLESDRPWTWAFCEILDAYGALIDDSYREMSRITNNASECRPETRRCIIPAENFEHYIVCRFVAIQEAVQSTRKMLSTGRSTDIPARKDNHGDFIIAQLLPPSVKSIFRYTIEKTLKTIARSLNILIQKMEATTACTDISKDQDSLFQFPEALARVFAWVSFAVNESSIAHQIDLCTGVRLWSCSEAKAEGPRLSNYRGKAKILVASEQGTQPKNCSMAKKLEKAISHANEVEQALQELNELLQKDNLSQSVILQSWDRILSAAMTRLKSRDSENFDDTPMVLFSKAVGAKVQQLQEQNSIYANKFQALAPLHHHRRRRKTYRSAVTDISKCGGGMTKKRRASSGAVNSVAAATASNKSSIPQNRNNLVQSWLEMDRETGRDESFQADAFVDLEDFLVEG